MQDRDEVNRFINGVVKTLVDKHYPGLTEGAAEAESGVSRSDRRHPPFPAGSPPQEDRALRNRVEKRRARRALAKASRRKNK